MITGVYITREHAPQVSFLEGSTVLLEIELLGKKQCDNLSVSLGLADDNQYRVFDTSSQRLTGKSFSINKDEKKKFVFELQLNLGPGSYHYVAYVYCYETQKTYDMSSVKTLFIESERDARGAANLFPKLLEGG